MSTRAGTRLAAAAALTACAALAAPTAAFAIVPTDASAGCSALKGWCGSEVTLPEPPPSPLPNRPYTPGGPGAGVGGGSGSGSAGGSAPVRQASPQEIEQARKVAAAKKNLCSGVPVRVSDDPTYCDPEPAAPAAAPVRGGKPPAPKITAAQAVQKARAQIKPVAPKIGSAPCTTAGCVGRVGVPVWLWTQSWEPQQTNITAGPFKVNMTAQPSRVVWSMGDGQSVTCTSPGTPYDVSMGWATSPDCGLPGGYERMGRYTMTATMTWDISWTGSVQGSDTITTTSTAPVAIGEVQALVTK